MTRSEHNPWLNRFAFFVALNTLALVGLGGLVTSKEAGMTVPDWPTSYGYNMFFFPISLWKGGIFYEHTHRLFASWVGFLTLGLAAWIWMRDSRSWLRKLGVAAVFLVILQGVLGGLRVVLFRDQIGIAHAALAQIFLAVLASIAFVTSPLASRLTPIGLPFRFRSLLAWVTGMIFLQLLLGATLRHEHAGLAIPDFPLAYGQLWPATDPATLQRINLSHADVTITPFQIYVHMAHRLWACVVLFSGLAVSWRIVRTPGTGVLLIRGAMTLSALLVTQAILGACTVWTGKAADVATLHVVLGAMCLVTAVLLTLTAERLSKPVELCRLAQPGIRTCSPASSELRSAALHSSQKSA